MILDVKMHTDDFCSLIIKDKTKYQPEVNNTVDPNQLKFKDTASIVSVIYYDLAGELQYYFKIFKHTDSIKFKVPLNFDGEFEVTYTVIPTYEWYERMLKSFDRETILSAFDDSILLLKDDTLIYLQGSSETYITSQEFEKLKDINSIAISNYSKKLFSICKLRKCYVNLCYQIFEDKAFSHCWNKSKIDSELIFKRDLVWMAINVILYLCHQENYEEAKRILVQMNDCNGVCPQSKTTLNKKSDNGCGCSNK